MTRSTFSTRGATPLALLIGVASAACGARSSLQDGLSGSSTPNGTGGADASSTAFASTGSPVSTSGPTAGAGGEGAGGDAGSGGAPAECDNLVWAGEPLLLDVTAAGVPTQLRLVQAVADSPTLTWAQRSIDTVVMSVTFDGWGAWPPALPEPRSHFAGPAPESISIADADDGYFLVSGRDATAMTIAAVDPVGDTVLTTVLPQVSGGTHAVARGPYGDLLVHGSPGTLLATEILEASGPSLIGTLGCASSPVLADVVAQADGSFLVASSNNDPFDECLDPDNPGPASTVQVHRIDGGTAAPGYSATMASALGRIQLVSDGDEGNGGAWLLYRAEGDADLHVERLDRDGTSTWSDSTTGNAIYEDAIDDWSTGYAHINTWPGSPDNETPPFVWLHVYDPEFLNQVTSFDFVEPIEVGIGAPTILTSPDERSLLAAWHWDATTIALLRAECL